MPVICHNMLQCSFSMPMLVDFHCTGDPLISDASFVHYRARIFASIALAITEEGAGDGDCIEAFREKCHPSDGMFCPPKFGPVESFSMKAVMVLHKAYFSRCMWQKHKKSTSLCPFRIQKEICLESNAHPMCEDSPKKDLPTARISFKSHSFIRVWDLTLNIAASQKWPNITLNRCSILQAQKILIKGVC